MQVNDQDRIIAQEKDGNFVILVNGIPMTLMGLVWLPGCFYMQKSGQAEGFTFWLLLLCGFGILAGGIALINFSRFERCITLFENRLVVNQWGREKTYLHSEVAELISKNDGEGGKFHKIVLKDSTRVQLPYIYKQTNLMTLYRGALKEAARNHS